jgi:hypothetical protein
MQTAKISSTKHPPTNCDRLLDRGSSAMNYRSSGHQPAYQSMINCRFMIVSTALTSSGYAEKLDLRATEFSCLHLETTNMRVTRIAKPRNMA